MSAYNFPAADFLPQLSGYTGQAQFRFWCQKVLPLVYDDSLSYYELLGKVVVYLNSVISDVSSAESNIDELATAFKLLQEYVNDYTLVVNPETVEKILSDHPEWTTTVEDGSITPEKLNESLSELVEGSIQKSLPPADSRYFEFEEAFDTPFRYIQSGCLVNGIFYLFSAVGEDIKCHIFNPNNPNPNATIDLGVKGHAGSAYYYDGYIYITGGYNLNDDTYNNLLYKFDVSTQTITTIDLGIPATGFFINDTLAFVMGGRQRISVYLNNGGKYKYVKTFPKELVSSSLQGGTLSGSYLYELRSYGSTSPGARPQTGYDLLVYTFNGEHFLTAKLLNVGYEPEWVCRAGSTLYVGNYSGKIYQYKLNGELFLQIIPTWNDYSKTPLHYIIKSDTEKIVTEYDGFSLNTVYFPPYNPYGNEVCYGTAELCNNFTPIARHEQYLMATTVISRSAFNVGIEVRYNFVAGDPTSSEPIDRRTRIELQVVRVQDFNNGTYYSSTASSIAFLNTIGATPRIGIKWLVADKNTPRPDIGEI